MNPDRHLINLIKKQANVQLIANPESKAMDELISNAHINLLYSDQSTGLKLKLINALYKGRFCLVNDTMLHGVKLENTCHKANSAKEFAVMIEYLFNQTFTDADIQLRKDILDSEFSNASNAEKLVKLIFDSND